MRGLALLVLLALLGLAQASTDTSELNYYELFGVARDSDKNEIRSVYRKRAFLVHPDKLPVGTSAAQVEVAEAAFARLANAYEVLTDDVLRTRYDYLLLEHGQVEYSDDRDWREFDAAHGGGGAGVYERIRRDARTAWAQAEDEAAAIERQERLAFILAFGAAAIVAALPSFYVWKGRRDAKLKQNQAETRIQEQLKETVEQVQSLRAERRERDISRQVEEIKYIRQRMQELKAMESEEEEEEEDDDQDDADRPVREKKPKKKKASGAFSCELCRKNYSSEAQLETHRQSKQHKQAERTQHKKPVRNRDQQSPADSELDPAALAVALKSRKQKHKGIQPNFGANTDPDALVKLEPDSVSDSEIEAHSQTKKAATADKRRRRQKPSRDSNSEQDSDGDGSGPVKSVGQLKKEKRKQQLAQKEDRARQKQNKK